MPKGRLPLGNPADVSRPAVEQEEGGYGLFMIRQLARKLRYTRLGDQNEISFRITLGAERHWENDLVV
jgi:serine/threonine-protein kinase RsbW